MPDKPDPILISGVTGLLGGRLAAAAMRAGCRVRTFSRREWDGEPFVPIEDRFFGSLPDGIPEGCLTGVETVIHCAATDRGKPREIEEINVRGSLRLAGAASKAGVRRMIYISSSSARPDAESAYGISKLKAEKELRAAGLEIVIIRPNLVVGPGKGAFGRMLRLVETLPVLPLLGGGRNMLQPVHVDDLCVAIMSCIKRGPEIDGRVFNIGDPDGTTLKELLAAIARDRLGRRRLFVSIPLEPVKAALRACESLGIRLPVTAGNVEGLKRAAFTETAGDLEELGVKLRPLAQAILDDKPADGTARPGLGRRPVRVLVAGAGRMGMVHAAITSRLKGAVLHGLIDRRRGPLQLLAGMGISAAPFLSLEDALSRGGPAEALIIATPSATHVGLAREALGKGMSVLIEKPLATAPAQLKLYAELSRLYPKAALGHGYALLNCPHVRYWLERLRSGEFGRPRGFVGFSLLGMVMRRTGGWQTRRASSGGGALVALGSHVLSVVHAAFGQPEGLKAEHARLHSGEVEDSALTHLAYPGFSGTHFASWSVPGRDRASHTLAVSFESGVLLITESLGAFAAKDGSLEIKHQLDFDSSHNMLPDSAGAGFSYEIEETVAAALSGEGNRKSFEGILDFEKLLYETYSRARTVDRFACADLVPRIAVPVPPEHGRPSGKRGGQLILDCREGPPEIFKTVAANSEWAAFQIFPEQFRDARRAGIPPERLRVTVPDFLGISRALLSRDFPALARYVSPAGLLGGASAALPALLRERGPNFWAAVKGMAGAALGYLPDGFPGMVLLHPHVVNLALILRQPGRVGELLDLCRSRAKKAKIGLHCGMPEDIAEEGWRFKDELDAVSVLTSPGSSGLAAVLRNFGGRHVTAETGPAPAIVQAAARTDPGAWGGEADSLLVGAAAQKDTAAILRGARAEAWERAFPGVSYSEIY